MEKTSTKRNKILLCIFVCLMILLGIRVFYIQIICQDRLSELAESQYEVLVDGLDSRGMILDRNNAPLTGSVHEYYYFIKRENSDNNLEKLIERINGRQIASESSQYYVYRTEEYKEELLQKLKEEYDAYVFKNSARYYDEQIACHLVGYLNEDENVGVSGIELLCQEQLASNNSYLTLWADAAGNLLLGTEPHKNYINNEKNSVFTNGRNVVTTIERRLQFVAEEALKEQEQSGAVVIMDGDSGEILAWASTPSFNPNSIEDYLQEDGDCLVNKVCQGAYPPGSVFKIVTAIAGLENGIDPEASFECTREIEIEGIKVGCMAASEDGHGLVNMEKAMAVSCNCYFAKIGEKVGYEKILETAKRMGFGEKTLFNFPEEIQGNLPRAEESGPWETSNISIGQGTVLATPLQVCKMTAVIANGGYVVSPKVIMGEETQKHKIISDEHVAIVEKGLKGVMTYGTAGGEWKLDIYGKTGTAETGSNDEESNVCWFTGYCRKDKDYVITIMLEKGTSGSVETTPVLKRIIDLLEKV